MVDYFDADKCKILRDDFSDIGFYKNIRLTGYIDALACLNPTLYQPYLWDRHVKQLPDDVRYLFDLFLMSRQVDISHLDDFAIATVQHFQKIGLANVHENQCQLNNIILYQCMGIPFFIERPSVKTRSYFGEDSFGLFCKTNVRRGDKVLDLCSGPGIQALKAGMAGAEVTCVEFNPIAGMLCELNGQINNLEQFNVRTGSLYDPVGSSKFDVVMANPPLVPVPEGLPYAFVGNGGPDGFDLTRRIINGLSYHLKSEGICQIVGMTWFDGTKPSVFEELENVCTLAGLSGTMTVLSQMPAKQGSPFYDSLLSTIETTGDLESKEVNEYYEALRSQYKCDSFCTFSLFLRNQIGKLNLFDVSSSINANFSWFSTLEPIGEVV